MFLAAMSLKTAVSASTLLCTSDTSANLEVNSAPSRCACDRRRCSTPAERDHFRDRPVASFHDDLDLLAGPASGERGGEIIDVVDALSVQLDQHVLRL